MVTALFLWIAGPQAFACDGPWTIDTLHVEVMRVRDALATGDRATAVQGAETLDRCMTELNVVLPPGFAGLTARAVGAGLALSDEPARGRAWLQTAVALEPTASFAPEDFGDVAGSPGDLQLQVTDAFNQARAELADAPALSKGFGSGEHYLDGRRISKPKAALGRHLLQQKDDAGSLRSWVIDGAGFPDEVLVDVEAGPGSVAQPELPGFTEPKPVNWPTERVVSVGLGGALLAGAGVAYLQSASANRRFHDANSVQDVHSAQDSSNRWFVASTVMAGAGGAAAGFGALFFIVDGKPATAVQLRF